MGRRLALLRDAIEILAGTLLRAPDEGAPMKLRHMVKTASFLWGAYRIYRRSRYAVRSNTKQALRRARKAI